MLGLALLVGVGAGLGAVVFRYMVEGLTKAFTGYRDYSGLGHVANPNLPALGPYFVLFTPIVAGLLYGPLVTGSPAKHAATVSPRSWSPSPATAAASARRSP